MSEYKYYQKFIFIGDKVRYAILKKIAGSDIKIKYSNEELESYNICLMYAPLNKVSILEEKKEIKIESNLMNAGDLIVMPKDIFDIEKYATENIETLLLVVDFPYNKLDLFEDIKSIRKNFKVASVKGIIYKEDRRFSSTDLSNEKDLINMTKKEFNKRNITPFIYEEDNEDILADLLSLKLDLSSGLKDVYSFKFLKAKKDFESKFEIAYEDAVIKYFKDECTILNPEKFEDFNKIFDYEELSKVKTIWANYVERFERAYIREDGVLEKILELFYEFTKKIAFWDWIESEDELINQISTRYKKFFALNSKIKVPKTEMEYLILKNNEDKSLEVIFNDKLKAFFDTELKNVIKGFIDKKFKLLKIEEKDI